jgi:hypothetical protein
MHGKGLSTDVPTTIPTMVHIKTPTRTLSAAERSPTPYPTLPADIRTERYRDLLAGNGICNLPCWWGIIPGETTWDEVFAKLSPLGRTYLYKSRIGYFSGFAPREMDPITEPLPGGYVYGHIDPSFLMDGDTIRAIDINSRWIGKDFDYSMANLLKLFGKPDEIWVHLQAKGMGDHPIRYFLYIFYKQKGMIFMNGQGTMDEQDFSLCPQIPSSYDQYPPYLFLWAESETGNFTDMITLFADNDAYIEDYRDLTTLNTEMNSMDDFYKTYVNQNNRECFSIRLPKGASGT